MTLLKSRTNKISINEIEIYGNMTFMFLFLVNTGKSDKLTLLSDQLSSRLIISIC